MKGPATPPATTRPYQDGVSLFRKRVKETLQGLGYGSDMGATDGPADGAADAAADGAAAAA